MIWYKNIGTEQDLYFPKALNISSPDDLYDFEIRRRDLDINNLSEPDVELETIDNFLLYRSFYIEQQELIGEYEYIIRAQDTNRTIVGKGLIQIGPYNSKRQTTVYDPKINYNVYNEQ